MGARERRGACTPYWQDLVGRAPGAVYRHLHHMLMSERIVDREGDDVYLTSLNIPRWHGIRTLFMHGEKSLVFNPQSATRSAIWLRDHLTPPPGVLRRRCGCGASRASATWT